MGFYQFFIIFICNTYLILFNAFTARADVDYDGPAVVSEGENFSITCNASRFSYIKWRLNETSHDFDDVDMSTPPDRCVSTLYVRFAKPWHAGKYKCSNDVDDFGHSLTVLLRDSVYSLSLKHNGNPCSGERSSSSANLTSPKVNCTAGNPYERFELKCISNPKLEDDDYTIKWYRAPKNKSDKEALIESSERIEVDDDELNIKSLDVVDAGQYFCRIVKKDQKSADTAPLAQLYVEVQVIPRVANLRKDVTAVEENPVTLNCTVTSSVPVKVSWKIDTPYGKNETFTASKDRIELMGNNDTLTNNLLVIKVVNMTLDRGSYKCWATSDYGVSSTSMTFHLRIKGKYAALWPFLGICTEVVILCVIILIYEKKRDKTELEESDTDQGPETKSSPDHGQDNVRYRK